MAVVKLGEEPRPDGIDLDRVIVDPDYRRRVIEKLRAEAATPPPPPPEKSSPAAAGEDD
jgi:hypothetical protein